VTLICAVGAGGFFGAVGDILLTSVRPTGPVQLPLHRDPQHRSGPRGHIGSVAQKLVTIGDHTLVLWAGPLRQARRVLQRIAVVSDGGRLNVDLKTVCADLEIDPSSLGLSLIHCFVDGEFVRFHSVNARGRSEPPFYFAGSGAAHFLDELRLSVGAIDGEQQNPFWNVFIPRILSAQLDEAANGGVFGHHYGGWYEIVELVDGRFCKRTLSLKIWEKTDDGLIRWGPLWFSRYDEDDLQVVRVLTHEHGSDRAEIDVNVTVVPSLLHPPKVIGDLNDLECACAVEFHVVVERATGEMHSVIIHGLKPGDRFRWRRTPNGAQLSVSPALQTALRRTADRFSLST
jgi:hypothetical protein